MPDPLDPILKALESVSEELSTVHMRLTRLEDASLVGGASFGNGGDGSDRAPGAPIVWRQLEVADRTALWAEFTNWVMCIADQFELTPDKLPRNCWWLHDGVVEELTALWTAYRSAFWTEQDSGASVYLWFDAFGRALDRISRSWLGECTNGYHQPRSRDNWSTDANLRAQILAAGAPGTSHSEPADTDLPDGITGKEAQSSD
ncbi:hypothetical protein [Streptomyces rhizosphaericus]|uniref:hypothetical protein n=1 Tax=Streptomyces rhizosphaericus TaxID=114699 RepID=UPI000A378F83|nr:hypothetical protein [Streptomyces rhizosphaericus]